MFKFHTRKMQNKRKTEFARIYLLACELQRSLLSPEEEDAANQSSACLVLMSSISMSSVQENCVHFSHSATCSVSSYNTSSHSFVRLFLSPAPQNRCWADIRCCPQTSVERFFKKRTPGSGFHSLLKKKVLGLRV